MSFKIDIEDFLGAVARLNSGGPKMTVSAIDEETEDTVICSWFDDTTVQFAPFHYLALTIVESEEEDTELEISFEAEEDEDGDENLMVNYNEAVEELNNSKNESDN